MFKALFNLTAWLESMIGKLEGGKVLKIRASLTQWEIPKPTYKGARPKPYQTIFLPHSRQHQHYKFHSQTMS